VPVDDCPQATPGCCCCGNRQNNVANDRFAFASSPRQTIYDLHGQMFVVEIKTVQLDSYSTGHEQRDGRTDGALEGRPDRVQGHAVGLSIVTICNLTLCGWMKVWTFRRK